MTEQQLLDRAIEASKGVSALACTLGLTNKAVYQWRKRGVPEAWQRVIRTEILKQKPAAPARKANPTKEAAHG